MTSTIVDNNDTFVPDEYQEAAIEMSSQEKVMILTGGPGTGKTFTINEILRNSKASKVTLAAPTGKAAKRMSEATNYPASTIHRLLEYSPMAGEFLRGKSHTLDEDLIIIDESSMLDTWLTAQLLQAIKPSAQVVFVGDKDQLPSVGPGNVFRDFIASGVLPVTELKTIHRQTEHSWIPINAQRINNGIAPEIDPDSDDFFVLFRDHKQDARETIIHLLSKQIPEEYGLPPEDVQLLCPQKPGILGCGELNTELQETLNPKQYNETELHKFRRGDKVIHLRNNYDLGVFNGETGIVSMINLIDKKLDVEYDNHVVRYDTSALADLALAYALTIHKSQGSEWPVIVVPLHSTNTFMLNRNLAYTAVTRGKRAVYVVCNQKGLTRAAKRDDAKRRYTGLTRQLKKAFR